MADESVIQIIERLKSLEGFKFMVNAAIFDAGTDC